MKLNDAIDDFILALKADGMVEKTVSWYRWLLTESPHNISRRFAGLGLSEMKDISVGDMRRYIVWLREQPNERTGNKQAEDTINAYVRALHRFFSWSAAEYGIGNPMARIAYPKVAQQKPKAISLDDLTRMFATCGDDIPGIRNRALLAFLIDTGCRAGGVCGLVSTNLFIDQCRAQVTEKGDRTRYVIFTERTAQYLREWEAVRMPVETVFYNLETGGRLTVSGLRSILRNIARRAKVTGRVNPHSFRHAFAREYILAGGDLATLAKLMGHAQVSTTVGYYTLFTDQEVKEKHEQFSPMARLEL
jgi:site-specific recombinase XerD